MLHLASQYPKVSQITLLSCQSFPTSSLARWRSPTRRRKTCQCSTTPLLMKIVIWRFVRSYLPVEHDINNVYFKNIDGSQLISGKFNGKAGDFHLFSYLFPTPSHNLCVNLEFRITRVGATFNQRIFFANSVQDFALRPAKRKRLMRSHPSGINAILRVCCCCWCEWESRHDSIQLVMRDVDRMHNLGKK